MLGGGDQGEGLHQAVEVLAVLQVAGRRRDRGGDRGRGVDLRDAVQAEEFGFVVLRGGGRGEEDEVVPLCLESGGVAAGDYWEGELRAR